MNPLLWIGGVVMKLIDKTTTEGVSTPDVVVDEEYEELKRRAQQFNTTHNLDQTGEPK